MTDSVIKFPVKIQPLANHEKLKDKLLDAISRQDEVERLQGHNNDITRCDYGPAKKNADREWLNIIKFDLNEHIKQWIKEFGYVSYFIDQIWFQQYATGGKHSWHVHGANFTGVYYLDLPGTTPKTSYVDPTTNKVEHFPTKEGDIIIFPSWVIHRGPENTTNDMKTIISWNMDVDLSDFYGDERD